MCVRVCVSVCACVCINMALSAIDCCFLQVNIVFMIAALVKVWKSKRGSLLRARMANGQRNESGNLNARERIKLFRYVDST